MRNESDDWRAAGRCQWFLTARAAYCLFVPHHEEQAAPPASQVVTYWSGTLHQRRRPSKHDSIIFNQWRLLTRAIIAKVHYSICESISSLLNGETVSVLSAYPKCTVPLFGSEISRLYCQCRETPDEYSERAARLETRKLKETHLWSHTMTAVCVCAYARAHVCAKEGEEWKSEGKLYMHNYFLYHSSLI